MLFWGLAVAFGIFFGFPNDLASLPPLILLWPLGLAILGSKAATKSAAFRNGWLASMAGAIPCLYWLALPVHDVGGLPLPLAGVCAVFIATCLAVQGGFFSLLACWVSLKLDGEKLAGYWRTIGLALYLGLAWALLEQFLAWLFGFPWLAIAGAMAAWPVLVQSADSLGAYAMAGLWVMAILLVWPVFSGQGRVLVGKRLVLALPGNSGWRFSPVSLLGLAIMAGLLAYGAISLGDGQTDSGRDPAKKLTAILVEGNVDQNQKWLPAFQQANVDLYTGLSRSGLAALADPQSRERQWPEKPDLVIWPETALPFFYETRPELASQIRAYVRESGVPLLFGAPGTDSASKSGLGRAGIYNRAFLLDGNGTRLGHYDKEHLVPFGEYLPEWLNWKFLEALLQGVGVYDQGQAIAPLVLPLGQTSDQGRISMGMLICYEGIFPWLARQRVADGAELLVDISNDGWFRDTPAARQHLYQTTLRALEQNRWLLRGTNTGISCAIDPRGRIVQRGGQFQTGWQVMTVWPERNLSLFYRLSPWLWPIFGILWLVMSVLLMYASDSTSNNRLENASPE